MKKILPVIIIVVVAIGGFFLLSKSNVSPDVNQPKDISVSIPSTSDVESPVPTTVSSSNSTMLIASGATKQSKGKQVIVTENITPFASKVVAIGQMKKPAYFVLISYGSIQFDFKINGTTLFYNGSTGENAGSDFLKDLKRGENSYLLTISPADGKTSFDASSKCEILFYVVDQETYASEDLKKITCPVLDTSISSYSIKGIFTPVENAINISQ